MLKVRSSFSIDSIKSKPLTVFEGYELSATDKAILESIVVPVSEDEAKRLEILRQTTLLDSPQSDDGFDRISALASRLFGTPYAAITLVDVDRVWFKSLSGIEITEIPRDYGFDSHTILSEMPDVYVVNDTMEEKRYINNPLVSGSAKVRFYAGTPVIIEGVKIGTLCIMDNEPRSLTLEEKENLLDLGAAVSLLAVERRDAALHLRSERANIVVSMMHNLRTPMTSLNFAASLLSNETVNPRRPVGSNQESTIENPITSNFQSTFAEINQALSQLNLLVDSTLCLGHAIIKCNSAGVGSNTLRNTQYVDCDLIAHLNEIYQKFAKDNISCKIQWQVDTKFLSKGKHVSYPDAILLVLISSIGHVSLEWKKIIVKFSFVAGSKNDVEFPELADKVLEGLFMIRIYPRECVSSANGDCSCSVNEYNYSSIDKILKSIGGGCKQSQDSTEIIHEFWVPCKIILFEDQLESVTTLRSSLLETNNTINYGSTTSPKYSSVKDRPHKRASIAQQSRTTLKVLVIEDTISVQKLLSRWLQKNGCTATCANNGKIGLDLLKSEVYDIVFVDFLMPVMLGLTTMKLLKEWIAASADSDPIAMQNSEALIVGMSATALESEQEEGFLHGMHFFMPKPADLQIMGVIINAKKTTFNNADAIEDICIATGTGESCDNGTNVVDSVIQEDENQLIPQVATVKKTAQWKLFKSFRQPRKIYPETKN